MKTGTGQQRPGFLKNRNGPAGQSEDGTVGRWWEPVPAPLPPPVLTVGLLASPSLPAQPHAPFPSVRMCQPPSLSLRLPGLQHMPRSPSSSLLVGFMSCLCNHRAVHVCHPGCSLSVDPHLPTTSSFSEPSSGFAEETRS